MATDQEGLDWLQDGRAGQVIMLIGIVIMQQDFK
jgi:hypothetical protein